MFWGVLQIHSPEVEGDEGKKVIWSVVDNYVFQGLGGCRNISCKLLLKIPKCSKHKWIKWVLNTCETEDARRSIGYKELIQPINQTVPCLAPQIHTQLSSRNPECEYFSWELACLQRSTVGHNPRAKPHQGAAASQGRKMLFAFLPCSGCRIL